MPPPSRPPARGAPRRRARAAGVRVAAAIVALAAAAGRAEAARPEAVPPGTKRHGCFEGSRAFGPLAVPTRLQGKAATPRKCKAACRGFRFFGILRNACSCAHAPPASTFAPVAECGPRGGRSVAAVYKVTGAPWVKKPLHPATVAAMPKVERVADAAHVGCFGPPTSAAAALGGTVSTVEAKVGPAGCRSLCADTQPDATYFSLTFVAGSKTQQCACCTAGPQGLGGPGQGPWKKSPKLCRRACKGAEGLACGDIGHALVYELTTSTPFGGLSGGAGPALNCKPGGCKPRKLGGASADVAKKTWLTKQNKAMDAFGLAAALPLWADSYLAWHVEHEQWICHCTSACDHGVCDILVDTQSSAGVQSTGQICADIEEAYGPAGEDPLVAPRVYFNTINCGNAPFTTHIVDSFEVPDEVWCPGRVDACDTCGQSGIGWDLSFYEGWKGKSWGPSYAPAAIGDTPEVLWRPQWYQLNLLLSTKSAGRKFLGCYPASAGADFVKASTKKEIGKRYLPWVVDEGMTLDLCKQYCITTSVEDKAVPAYKFFTLQSGGTCTCSATSPGPAPVGGACTVPCEGDSTQTCGGGDHLSVNRITDLPKKWLKAPPPNAVPETEPDPEPEPAPEPEPEPPAPVEDDGGDEPGVTGFVGLGCFFDSAADRLLEGPSFASGSMTLAACQSFCATSGGHSHFGTEFGKECYCGSLPPDAANIAAGVCGMACKGNAAENCGGVNAINVFELSGNGGGGAYK